MNKNSASVLASAMSNLRVLVLTPALTPYRLALFNTIQRSGGCDLFILALTHREANRLWSIDLEDLAFEYRVLEGVHLRRDVERSLHINTAVWRSIRQIEPDVVVTSGYDQPAYWQAMLAAGVVGARYVLWSGTTRHSARTRSGFQNALKRTAISAADALIAYGQEARSYLESLGAAQDRIRISLNTVDMDHIRNVSSSIRRSSTFSTRRAQYPPLLMLFAGQLIPRKGISELLTALGSLRDTEVGLIVAGAGPQEAQLRDRCIREKIPNVYFEGYLQLPGLMQAYSIADILVMPSLSETWGLVVNEGLATGLYSFVSERAGVRELILPGFNGELFDPCDSDQLRRLIAHSKSRIPSIRARRPEVAEHACKTYSLQSSAAAFVAALRLDCPKQ